jgi:hypothetical protein
MRTELSSPGLYYCVMLYVLRVVMLYVLRVNVYCHRVSTQLQLTNISYHIITLKHNLLGKHTQMIFDTEHSRRTAQTIVLAIPMYLGVAYVYRIQESG